MKRPKGIHMADNERIAREVLAAAGGKDNIKAAYHCDRSLCDHALDHSLAVARTMTRARRSAGVRFAADHMAPAVCARTGEEA